jgi:hypothetical protein
VTVCQSSECGTARLHAIPAKAWTSLHGNQRKNERAEHNTLNRCFRGNRRDGEAGAGQYREALGDGRRHCVVCSARLRGLNGAGFRVVRRHLCARNRADTCRQRSEANRQTRTGRSTHRYGCAQHLAGDGVEGDGLRFLIHRKASSVRAH